jgi:hypothetical protein
MDGWIQNETQQNELAAETAHAGGGPKQDPTQPGRKRGDGYVLVGLLAGFVLGAGVGVLIALMSATGNWMVTGFFGNVAGGLFGVWFGDRYRQKKLKGRPAARISSSR